MKNICGTKALRQCYAPSGLEHLFILQTQGADGNAVSALG